MNRPDLSLFSKTDKIVFGIFALVIVAVVLYKVIDPKDAKADITKSEKNSKSKKSKKDKSDGKSSEAATQVKSNNIAIIKKWDLPAELKEISGLSYVDNERLGCVQDESGTIYMYNTSKNEIEKKIPFGKKGDYEGLAVKGDTVYVVRADGKLFEVDIRKPDKPAIKEYSTSLTVKHNVEGLCYDKARNRLLLAIKDEEPGKPSYKGIYAFDLSKHKFIDEPVLKIDLEHQLLKTGQKKPVMPSGISVHPKSNEIFITDGPQARLLVLTKEGEVKQLLDLGDQFSQPEGITFNDDGQMYISNEGTKGVGNIIQVQLSEG